MDEIRTELPARRRRRSMCLAICVVVAATCLLRLGAVAQLEDAGLLDQHRWASTDMHFFDGWARSIVAGDVWTDKALHPHHDWHAESAAIHFITHPEREAELGARAQQRADGSTAATLLWDDWYGGVKFHQEPLYPYVVAAVYAAAGLEVRVVFACQVALGLLSLGLLWSITARLFGRPAALAALVLAAGYETLIVYEFVLLRATSTVFFALLLVRVTMWAWRRQTARRGFVLGACCGLAVLLKATFALVPLGTAVALVVAARRAGRPLASVAPAAIGGLVGALLIASPVFVRNARVGAPITSLSSVGPVSMLVNNAAGDGPSVLGSYRDPWVIARVMGESGGDSQAVTRAMLFTHEHPWDVLGYGARRLLFVAHGFEAPNNISVVAYRDKAPALGFAVIGWSFVLPWALLGVALVLRQPARRRRAAAALGSLAAALFPLIAFASLARYRLVFVVLAMPFAAHGLVRALAWVRAREWRALLIAAPSVVVLSLFVGRSLPPGVHAVRVADITASHRYALLPRVDLALAHGDAQRAESLLAQALADEPREVARLGRRVDIQWGRTAELATHFASLWRALGKIRADLGRADQSTFALTRAELLEQAVARYEAERPHG